MKKEPVLSIAVILAVISMFVVHLDDTYASYIDFRTLAILFCLMVIVAGMREIEKGSGESLEKSVTSSLNKKNEALLTGNTSGSMPYIIKEMSPSIQGVVVAAKGNITQTKIRDISEAVQALFGIEAHKIKVIEKKSQAEEAK